MARSEQMVSSDDSTARQRAVLILVVLATSLVSLEVGLVTVALPVLAAAFDASTSTIQWVALAYQLTIVGTLILFGRLVDAFGGRTVYLAGMFTVLTAAILATFSPHVLWLIVARGLLGLGAAMLLATGQALITVVYGAEGRGRALGVMHMGVAGGLVSGPAIGGLLVTVLDWRMIFLAPIPVALPALVWGWRALPVVKQEQREPLDVIGAALIFIAAGSGVLGLSRVASDSSAAITSIMFVCCLVATGLFIATERRNVNPLLDLSLLRNWRLTAGLLAAFLTFVAMASNMFLIPFALQDLMGHSPARSGLIMMVVPLMILPIAPFAGIVADRRGVQLPAAAGLTAIVIAIFGMSQFQASSTVGFAVIALVLYGIGAGLFQAPNNSAVLGAAPEANVGTVSGMLAFSRNLGQIVGIAVASTVWTLRETHYARTTDSAQSQILSASLGDAFLVLAAIGSVALLVSLTRNLQDLECQASP